MIFIHTFEINFLYAFRWYHEHSLLPKTMLIWYNSSTLECTVCEIQFLIYLLKYSQTLEKPKNLTKVYGKYYKYLIYYHSLEHSFSFLFGWFLKCFFIWLLEYLHVSKYFDNSLYLCGFVMSIDAYYNILIIY